MRNRKSLSETAWVAAGVLLCAAVALMPACSPSPAPEQPRPAPKAAVPEPVRITQFYASPPEVTRGENVTVCYGVVGADAVKLEPNVKALKPGRNRCFTFAPAASGTYRLTATGPGGEASEELSIRVRRPVRTVRRKAVLGAFVASAESVPKGGRVTLCYSVDEAASVAIDPPVQQLEPVSRCFTIRIDKTTTFTLTATAPDGRKERKQLTVKVP